MMKNINIHSTARVSDQAIIRGVGKVIIEAHVKIEENVLIDSSNNNESTVTIRARSKIKTGSVLKSYAGLMDIGPRTSIGEYNILTAHGGLTIGSKCMFGPYTFVNSASHITEGVEAYRFQGEVALGITIGDNVWLGARSTVLDGVSIGSNTIVGAHSLVLKSLPEYSVAYGQPATIRRKNKRNNHYESIC